MRRVGIQPSGRSYSEFVLQKLALMLPALMPFAHGFKDAENRLESPALELISWTDGL